MVPASAAGEQSVAPEAFRPRGKPIVDPATTSDLSGGAHFIEANLALTYASFVVDHTF
jgi:hypothetical protein